MDIASNVHDVIADFDQNFVGEISGDLTLRHDLAWDSMDLVGIVDCLVECFGLKEGIEADFLESINMMSTVSDLVAYVSGHNPTTYNRWAYENIGGTV